MISVELYVKCYSKLLIFSVSLRDKYYYFTLSTMRKLTWGGKVGELSRKLYLAHKRYLSEVEAMPPIFDELNTAAPVPHVTKRDAGVSFLERR